MNFGDVIGILDVDVKTPQLIVIDATVGLD
jgi:dihydroneopterin aldolase